MATDRDKEDADEEGLQEDATCSIQGEPQPSQQQKDSSLDETEATNKEVAEELVVGAMVSAAEAEAEAGANVVTERLFQVENGKVENAGLKDIQATELENITETEDSTMHNPDMPTRPSRPKYTTPDSASTNTEALPTAPPLSERWATAIHTVRVLICRSLKVITHHAATHPWVHVIAISIISIGMVTLGLITNFQVEVDGDYLWPPRNSLTQRHQKWIISDSNFAEQLFYSHFYIHASGDNIPGNESVAKAFEVVDTITALPNYESVCNQPYTDPDTNITMECSTHGVVEFWNLSSAVFEVSVQSDEDAILQMSATHFPNGKVVDPSSIFGNFAYNDTTGLLMHLESYHVYLFYPITDPANEFLADVTDAILELQSQWDTADANNPFQVEIFTKRSFNDEFQRAIVNDIPLMPFAFIVMSCFCCLVFARWDRVRSQTLVGFGAVVSVLFAILTGYGLLFLCGIPLTAATQIVVFVMFGIGLDDAFIISGSYNRTDPRNDPVERLADTMDDVGLSIAITTITSALAFAIGCISSINAVYWLCLYAFPTIIIDFLYQITFFVALIAIDDRRMKQNRMDCLVCVTVRPNDGGGDDDNANDEEMTTQPEINPLRDDSDNTSLSSRLMAWYAHHLLKPWAKATVLVAFTALFGACIYGTTQLRQEMDFVDLVPSDSYVKDFFDAQKQYTASTFVIASAYFRYIDQSDPLVRRQMKSYIDDLVAASALNREPPYCWVRDFDTFLDMQENNATASFGQHMDAFLAHPLYGSLYQDMIVQDDLTGQVLNSRVALTMDVDHTNSRMLIDQLALLRSVSGSQPLNEQARNPGEWSMFTHDRVYNMWEFFTVVVDELIFTTLVAVVAVSIIGVAFIPHWTAVLFVFPSIASVYIDLLGLLYFMGVRINPVSYITLVMSVGLLVDFIMHILLRYYECRGSREERVKETLTKMGSSILIGGVSTFLGVCLLALSTSVIFQTIFRAFIALVTLGVGYGLILLPVVLSLIGPYDCAD